MYTLSGQIQNLPAFKIHQVKFEFRLPIEGKVKGNNDIEKYIK